MTFFLWAQASRLAAQTPPQRNRYVDFLRAASICVVILGHWLLVAPYVEDGQLVAADALSLIPWTRWLTWLLQVMPIFFLVGGFANGIGWQSAQRRQDGYAPWLAARLQRLVSPVLPVLAAWTLIGLAAVRLGADPALLKVASQFALLPAWFLVVYILVVLLAPLAYRAWQRYGFASFWALAAGAALVDLLALGAGWRALGWLNYLFVWLAIHQLGFAWQAGRLAGPRRCLPWAVGGLAALIALVALGPYPLSMVSVRGDEISNSLPPNLTMLALGVFQSGLLLALEQPIRRRLEGRFGGKTTAPADPPGENLAKESALWTVTVLINGMIMTIFLWHVTALLLVSGLALLTGVGLTFIPDTGGWWLTRPLWLAVLAAALIPFVAVFTRFERIGTAQRGAAPPAWRLLLGCGLICFGLATLTLQGVPTESWPGINLLALALPFVGAALVRFGPARA